MIDLYFKSVTYIAFNCIASTEDIIPPPMLQIQCNEEKIHQKAFGFLMDPAGFASGAEPQPKEPITSIVQVDEIRCTSNHYLHKYDELKFHATILNFGK